MSLFDQLSGFEFPDVLMNSGPLPSTAGGPAGSDGSVDGVINGTNALLENISPYALGKSARTGSDRNYQQIPHRFQYIIPKLFLPHFDHGRGRCIPVSHAVDQGDIAFLLYGGDRAWFTSAQQFRTRAPPCAFATIDVVNYLLLCMQAATYNETWDRLTEDLIKDAQFQAALKKRRGKETLTEFEHVLVFRAIRLLIQQCFVPHGICAGSEHQGGQHEHDGGQPVQAAVNFVTTMTVDGKNVDLVNYWYEHSMIAGDELIFKLEKQHIRSKVFHLTKYYKEPVPMTVRTGPDDAAGDYHYWQLVPAILREPSGNPLPVDRNTFWHDHRSEGYWRIAQTFQTRAQNNSVKAFNQGLPLEVTFSPVWRSFSDCQYPGAYGPSIKVQVDAHDTTKQLTAHVTPKQIIWKYDAKDIFTLELKRNKYEVKTDLEHCKAWSAGKDLPASITYDKAAFDIQFICFQTDDKDQAISFKFEPLSMSSAQQAGTVSKKAPYQVVIPVSESRAKTEGVAYHVKMKIERDGKAAGFLHNFKCTEMKVLNNNLWHGHAVVPSITIAYTPLSIGLGGMSQFLDDEVSSSDSSRGGGGTNRSAGESSQTGRGTDRSGRGTDQADRGIVRSDGDKADDSTVLGNPRAGSVRTPLDPLSKGRSGQIDDGDIEEIIVEDEESSGARFPTAASFGLAPSAAAQGPAKKPRKTLRFLSDAAADAKPQGPTVSTADSGR